MLAKTADTSASDTGVHLTLDPWGAEAASQRLAQHYQRKNDKPNVERVIRSYGTAFAHLASAANPMMAMIWLQPVIERYEQAGLKADAEKLRVAAGEKGKNIASDLKTVSVEVKIPQNEINDLLEYLTGSGDLKTSLLRIAKYFLPITDDARKSLKRAQVDAPLTSMFSVTFIESSGFPTASVGSFDDDAEGRLYMQLGETIMFYQPFLELALVRVRERYKLTTDAIVNALNESPLFSSEKNELLREGLSAYQEEDFVKAIHVLVPQVEHILRNFMGRLGIPTRKTVRGRPGTTDAKSLNDVLGDVRVREKLTENLWRYLSVVYVERRGGMNLRNDLAHGLFPADACKRHIADRVVHTLLAISLMRAEASAEV